MTVSPTVRRRRLAAELRRLRGLAEVTQQQAATHLGCTQAKIGRFETAKRSPSIGDVSALLDFYAVNGAEREQLINLARDARKRGWWHSYSDVLPEWYETYVGLEAEASCMHTWESEAVPGLLQTAEYAYAITRSTLIRAEPTRANSLALKLVNRSPMPQIAKLTIRIPNRTAMTALPTRDRLALRNPPSIPRSSRPAAADSRSGRPGLGGAGQGAET